MRALLGVVAFCATEMPKYWKLLNECRVLHGKLIRDLLSDVRSPQRPDRDGGPDFTLYSTNDVELTSGKVVIFRSCSEY